MARASDVLNLALAEIGVTEYPPGSNNVKYNTAYYNGRSVSGSAYPWCCVFVWWILSAAGVSVPKTALCTTLADYFKKQGRFFTSNPKPGDVVFFKFSTNFRWTNHVGFVVEVRGNEIETIEGNTSVNSDDNGGAVMRRKRSKNIVGYGRPQYDVSTAPSAVKPVLKRGDRNEYVRAWQNYLITQKISCGKSGADGIFGRDTENAVRVYQTRKRLPITGVIDADDWNSVGK